MSALQRVLVTSGIAVSGAVTTLTVEAILGFSGGSAEAPPGDPDGVVGSGDQPPLSLVILGDSTGAALGASHVEMGYPRLIAHALATATNRRVRLHVRAVSGARVADVHRSQLTRIGELEPDVVLLAVGGNDVIHLTRRSAARRHLRAVIEVCTLTGARVVVAGVPAMGTTRRVAEPLRSLIRLVAHRLDAVWREETAAAGAVRVELAALTGPAFAADGSLFAADLFHPSDAGYALWAKVLGEGVMRAHELGSRGQGALFRETVQPAE